MLADVEFYPDGQRARSLDMNMHRELGLSLQHVCEASRHIIPFDNDKMGHLTTSIAHGVKYRPSAFGRYYSLVEAIQNDDLAEAALQFQHLEAARPASPSFELLSICDNELQQERDLFLEKMNADASIDIRVQGPTTDVAKAFLIRLKRALILLDRELPEMSSEIRGIVRQIVIVASDPARKLQFDGGSHFQLWGALFLNGAFHPTDIDMVEVLAHESAHSLLFGFCTDEPLVLNEDDERFASPLRADLRPMDGIYHATFVSARMHWAMSKLSRSMTLTTEQREYARIEACANFANFAAGYGVVAAQGLLTDLGARIMHSAKCYIESTV